MIYKFYTDTLKRYRDGEHIDINELKEYLLSLDKLYAKGELTGLTDEEYDRIHQIYIELSGNVVYGGMDRVKVKHDYLTLKGTIKKVHYVTEEEKMKDPGAIKAHKVLGTWLRDTYQILSEAGHTDPKCGLWPKYDGISIVLSLDENGNVLKAITRGEEEYGIDKTGFFKNINCLHMIPKEFRGQKVGIKTECIMRSDLFKEYNKKYGNNELVNPRTAITSLINSETFTEIHRKYVSLIPLMICVGDKQIAYSDDEYGPPIAGSGNAIRTICNSGRMNEYMDNMHAYIEKYIPYDCDGVVVRWYDEKSMEILGRDEENFINKFEIAYKFPKANNYTKVINIIQDIGLMGKVSYTAEVEPITINDKVIRHASLGSEDKAKELKLAKGDMVNIKYEIIPYLCIDKRCEDNRSGNEPIPLITHCPYCGQELTRNPELGCYGNQNCPSRVQGKIYNFCERMNISGVGESTIEQLHHHHLLTRIEDLFLLKDRKEEFLNIDGMGEKTFKSITKQLDNIECTETQLLSSIGIRGIGPKNSKKLMSIYYLDELKKFNKNSAVKLINIEGISLNKADKIIEGVMENLDLINFLQKHCKVKKEKNNDNLGEIVFTGFRNIKFKEFLEKLGYEVTDSVNSKTILVIAENVNATTSKLTKAKERGIAILGEHEAYEKFGFVK